MHHTISQRNNNWNMFLRSKTAVRVSNILLDLPDIISREHNDTKFSIIIVSPFWMILSFKSLTIKDALELNVGMQLSKILKWNAGVSNFLFACHFAPGS